MCNYYRDEPSNPLSSNSESFKYKTSITGKTHDVDAAIIGDGGNPIPNPDYDANKVGKNETEITVPLKNLCNFRRTLNIPLINCKIESILTWTKNIAMPMYNLIEYSDNYSDTSGSLWQFKRDEIEENINLTVDDNHTPNNLPSFKYKSSLITNRNDVKIAAPLRYIIRKGVSTPTPSPSTHFKIIPHY